MARPDPFGRVLARPEPEIENFRKPFSIRGPIGMEAANRRRDVAKVESLLGRTGALDLDLTDGVTGYFGPRVDQAVRRFQKARGLKVDGVVNPRGETMRTLKAVLGKRRKVDSEIDDGSDEFPESRIPLIPEPPFDTRDPMNTQPNVPGTRDNNVIEDIIRLLRRRRDGFT